MKKHTHTGKYSTLRDWYFSLFLLQHNICVYIFLLHICFVSPWIYDVCRKGEQLSHHTIIFHLQILHGKCLRRLLPPLRKVCRHQVGVCVRMRQIICLLNNLTRWTTPSSQLKPLLLLFWTHKIMMTEHDYISSGKENLKIIASFKLQKKNI